LVKALPQIPPGRGVLGAYSTSSDLLVVFNFKSRKWKGGGRKERGGN